MICLSSTLVKPELLIKSFFSSPKFSKAELAVLRFQREYTVNVTGKKKNKRQQPALKIKKTPTQKKDSCNDRSNMGTATGAQHRDF